MSEQKPDKNDYLEKIAKESSEPKPKKMVRRSVAVALGIVCIILVLVLAISLVEVFDYYTPIINDKNNTISSLSSQLSNVNSDFSNYENLKDFRVVMNYTITAMQEYEGVADWSGVMLTPLYSGYLSVTIHNATENPITFEDVLSNSNHNYIFDYKQEIPINGTSYFPVMSGPFELGSRINFYWNNPVLTDDNATVTVIYYY
jgi:hypothetical protein